MLILGINAYHADAAACILRDGRLLAAAEEERFRRVKHWAGFPRDAIAYCLKEAKAELSDLDYVAVNRSNRANLARKVAYVLAARPSFKLLIDRLRNRAKWASVADQLAQLFPAQRLKGQVRQVEHHFAHLASAFYASPFPQAVVVSVDGFGDFASAAWGVGHERSLTLDGRVLFPHSLGIFYQALTQYLGFPSYGDEYKAMGLAAYGKAGPLLDQVRRLVKLEPDGRFALDLRFFRHQREDIGYEWEGGSPDCQTLFSSELEHALGPRRAPSDVLTPRHYDIAFATQAVFEDAFFHLLGALERRYGANAIALAGGCAYNSVANGKLADRTGFKRCYLQSAAGDAGGAIGAAYATWHAQGGTRAPGLTHAYWGPQFSDAEIAQVLAERRSELESIHCVVTRCKNQDALAQAAASAIADGMVVGWFQERMEWGPRALGNRSIIADPRRADMRDILNRKIKRRESFRPFAPAILRHAVADWFERDGDVPFMLQVFPIRRERREQIPAVTHVDGTGRLQTVDRDGNARFYALIDAFRRLTGVPMVLNTSFNENEPIVCRPEEALDCFLRTSMDVLFLGDFMISRINATARSAEKPSASRYEHKG
jgi:carbamoyltransferase